MSAYMGIDIGTTGCKAISFDETGNILASSYREYPLLTPKKGWAELDSNLVIKMCYEVISETANNTSLPILALAISSQGEAFTPLDNKGNILSNAMVSSDIRAADIAESWSEQFGAQKLYEISGHTAHSIFTLFKLLWLRENQTEVWQKTAKFLCFEDLLQYKLGVDPAISWSLAGRTMMFDIKNHRWDDSILEKLELGAEKLARPVKSGSLVGSVTDDMAEKLGLDSGVAVVSGGHDQGCGALGAGVIDENIAMYATGTVECITPAFTKPQQSESLFKNNLCTYDYTAENMYTTVAYSLTGGNILKWYRDNFAREEVLQSQTSGVNAYKIILDNMKDEPSDLMVLPYFTPSGTPYFESQTMGTIIGLNLNTEKKDIIRALLEGVAYEMRLNLDLLNESNIRINELRAIGGGAKNRKWTQLKADVLNKPITNVEVTEAGCLGAAALAFAAVSNNDIKTIIKKWVKTGETVEPNPEFIELYSDKFKTYKKVYPAIKTLL